MPYKFRIRLGYAGINTALRAEHIFTSRTCRLATIYERGIEFAIDLARKNLDDLYQVLVWNELHGIRFFRMSSDMFPHITDGALIAKKSDPKKLAYSLGLFEKQLKKVGKYARMHGHRLTFHPDQFVILSGSDTIRIRSVRDLWMHASVLDLMGLGDDSVMIIHGGGVYGDKPAAMSRWISAYDLLPVEIKRRLVIENDERSYGIGDILELSRRVAGVGEYKIPIVFDYFHYKCFEALHPGEQPRITEVMQSIVDSWHGRPIKMHISEQRPDSHTGTHADYVRTIPKVLLDFPKLFGMDLYLMVEAKQKEAAVEVLRKKYKICS
jgi:UV DNA damage endonuclease